MSSARQQQFLLITSVNFLFYTKYLVWCLSFGFHCIIVFQRFRVQILTLIPDPQFLPVDVRIVLTLGYSCLLQQFVSAHEQHTGKHDIMELQKTAILVAAHKLRKVQTYMCSTFNMGNTITCSTNCDYTSQMGNIEWLQHYTRIQWKCDLFRFIIVKTLHILLLLSLLSLLLLLT